MPTPFAHTGLAVAITIATAPAGAAPPRQRLGTAALLVALANAADLDFLPGLCTGNAIAYHHGVSHSLVFALALGLLAARFTGRGPALLAALSHPLLDWLTGEPGADAAIYGVQLFWPLPGRYMSALHMFGVYHIDALGLLGGVLAAEARRPLLREVAFVCATLGAAGLVRSRTRPDPERLAPVAPADS